MQLNLVRIKLSVVSYLVVAEVAVVESLFALVHGGYIV